MNYIFLISILLIISQEIILFNEELLILLIFINFFIITSIKLKKMMNHFFQLELKKIETTFLFSFNTLKQIILLTHKQNESKQILKTNFKKLKNHYLHFNLKMKNKLIQSQIQQKNMIFIERFKLTFQFEQQILKLLIFIYQEKLILLTSTIKFCDKQLNLKKYTCLKKINIREQLKNI